LQVTRVRFRQDGCATDEHLTEVAFHAHAVEVGTSTVLYLPKLQETQWLLWKTHIHILQIHLIKNSSSYQKSVHKFVLCVV